MSCNFVCVYATMHVCLSVGCPCVSMHGYVCVVYTATERYTYRSLHTSTEKTQVPPSVHCDVIAMLEAMQYCVQYTMVMVSFESKAQLSKRT